MRAFYIDLAENKSDLRSAMMLAMRVGAEKIILIGSNAEMEQQLRGTGHLIEVLPVGSKIPEDAARARPRLTR